MTDEPRAPSRSVATTRAGFERTSRASSRSTQLTLTPLAGWFIMDSLDMTSFTILGEPSFHVHVPVNTTTLAFAGLGLGVTWENELGIALAAVPRIGVELPLLGDVVSSAEWRHR